MGMSRICSVYRFREAEQDVRYEKLYYKNQLCLGVCIVFVMLTVAMVIASTQDAATHSILRLPIIGTGLFGLVFCGFGFRLNSKVQQYA